MNIFWNSSMLCIFTVYKLNGHAFKAESLEIYKTLKFLPEKFQEYLIAEVGFELCEEFDVSKAKSKGEVVAFVCALVPCQIRRIGPLKCSARMTCAFFRGMLNLCCFGFYSLKEI